ncbi:MAG: Clp protease N-terminal domain-containing protein, partial [Hyphomicrobium sp.]
MMGYRGDDLDLRTPQTWNTGPGSTGPGSTGLGSTGGGEASGWAAEGGRGRGYGTRGPIWVDDTVLACANHAFDVALAHRAGEVRIEHLLYALTRIDAAAETLEKRGVRVASLRREAATVIASDIPIGLPSSGNAVPRRSEALEEALRLAAVEAGRRNAPATPDDLLTALLDIRPDLPGLGLLARHTVRVVRE